MKKLIQKMVCVVSAAMLAVTGLNVPTLSPCEEVKAAEAVDIRGFNINNGKDLDAYKKYNFNGVVKSTNSIRYIVVVIAKDEKTYQWKGFSYNRNQKYEINLSSLYIDDEIKFETLDAGDYMAGIEVQDWAGNKNMVLIDNFRVKYNSRSFVGRLYHSLLKREPDEGGFNAWNNSLVYGGNSASNVVKGFYNSPEFGKNKLTDEQYVVCLYMVVLQRNPDMQGYNAWVAQLKHGKTREHVLNGFLNSEEFLKLCNKYGIRR